MHMWPRLHKKKTVRHRQLGMQTKQDHTNIIEKPLLTFFCGKITALTARVNCNFDGQSGDLMHVKDNHWA